MVCKENRKMKIPTQTLCTESALDLWPHHGDRLTPECATLNFLCDQSALGAKDTKTNLAHSHTPETLPLNGGEEDV